MKNFVKLVLTIVLILAVVLSFGACSSGKPKKSENAIEGKWFLGEDFDEAGFRFPDELEFFADGSMQGPAGGKYTISGDRIQIHYTASDSYTYTFKIEDNMLRLVDSETGDYYGEYIYYRESGVKSSDSDSETTTVPEAEKLSASCDHVLDSATDSKGNIIELVANDSKTYDGSQSIGLIKNNKWIIEMTDDSPLITDSGVVFGFDGYKNHSIISYELISDNCFMFTEYEGGSLFWNYETGKVYRLADTFDDIVKQSIRKYDPDYGYDAGYDSLSEELILIKENDKGDYTFKIFNTRTMSIVKSFPKNYFHDDYFLKRYVKEFSDGLFFAYREKNGDSNSIESGFYDVNGNLVIDFSKFEDKYDIKTYPERFIDGKTSFIVINASGKEFEITIDKQGNVLSETAV